MKLRLLHQGLMAFSIILLVELVLVSILAGLLGRSHQALDHADVAVSVVSHMEKIRTLLVHMEISAHEQDAQIKLHQGSERLSYELNALRLFLKDDPDGQTNLERFEAVVAAQVRRIEFQVNRPLNYEEFEKSSAFISQEIDVLSAHYRRTAEFLPDRATLSSRITESNLLYLVLINAVLAVGIPLHFMQGIVNRLGIVADNSVRFGRGQELNPPLTGEDEIAMLDRILHDTIEQRTLVETLLKESEARTRLLIENMPVGVVTIDEKGIIESINPQTEKIFGYVFDELIGDHLMALFSLPAETQPPQFIEMLYQRVLGSVAKFHSRRKDGEIFPIEMTLNEYDSLDGKRYLAIFQDITEREKAERFKQELIAMVSHDLRSPLTSVQGVMSLLGRGMYGQLSGTGEQRVKVAEQSLARLIHLVDDLLDLERLEAGKLQFNQETVAVSSIIDRSIELVYDFAQASQLKFDAPACDLEVYGDEDRLVQVVVNLLSNAIKFSPKGAIISIHTADRGRMVEISVQDEGPGIASEHLDKIFDRFHQGHSAPSSVKGSGLGLAICRAIVEGHGGTIGVATDVGKGSTFSFLLPKESDSPLILSKESEAGPLAV